MGEEVIMRRSLTPLEEKMKRIAGSSITGILLAFLVSLEREGECTAMTRKKWCDGVYLSKGAFDRARRRLELKDLVSVEEYEERGEVVLRMKSVFQEFVEESNQKRRGMS